MTRHVGPGRQGVFVLILAVVTGAAVPPVGAASAEGSGVRPAPIQKALDLLKWRTAHIPNIVVVSERPSMVSPLAEGWVVHDADGGSQATIYVAAWSELYRNALAEHYHVSHNIIRLAGVLAHERAHISHGEDEEAAYLEQLTTLEALRADPLEIANVRRALESVRRARQPTRR